MKIHEITEAAGSIEFGTGYIKPVTSKVTQAFLDNGLFMDQDGKQFKSWWTNPEQHFKAGGIFSIAYSNGTPIAVGVIKLPKQIVSGDIDGVPSMLIGVVGFFVNEQYRASGIASTLAHGLEKKYFQTFSASDKQPIAICTGAACDVAKNFTKIQVTT